MKNVGRQTMPQAATGAGVRADDIRHLGPGLDGVRITADEWAGTARAFNSEFANQFLVLVAARTIYPPVFANRSRGVDGTGALAFLKGVEKGSVCVGRLPGRRRAWFSLRTAASARQTPYGFLGDALMGDAAKKS